MRLLLSLLLASYLPATVLAAGGYGRVRVRQSEALSRYTAAQRREVKEIRAGLVRLDKLRALQDPAGLREAGYPNRAALEAALPKLEDSLVERANKIKYRDQETLPLFREVVQAVGSRRSAEHATTLRAEINKRRVKDVGEPHWALRNLAKLQQEVRKPGALLTASDQRALLKEIDAAALKWVVESKRYREPLATMKAKLDEGKRGLDSGYAYALHPLQQALHANRTLRRVQDYVPTQRKSVIEFGRNVDVQQPVFVFHLEPRAPAEVERAAKELPLLQKKAAVRVLRHGNSLLASGKLKEAKAAVDWLTPAVKSMRELSPLLARVARHHERRLAEATRKPLDSLQKRLTALQRQPGNAEADRAPAMEAIVGVIRASRDASLFGRGAELTKEALTALAKAANEQTHHLASFEDDALRADARGDAYGVYMAGVALQRAAERARNIILPIYNDRRLPFYAPKNIFERLSRGAVAGEHIARESLKAMNAAAGDALASAWQAIRAGETRDGAHQAAALTKTFAAWPSLPNQAELARKARILQHLAARAPIRRSRALRSELQKLRRTAKKGKLRELMKKAERLRRRAEGYADLDARRALLADIETLYLHLQRMHRRAEIRHHNGPSRHALKRLRQAKALLRKGDVDGALKKLEARLSTKAHRRLIEAPLRKLRAEAVQRKAETLLAEGEALLAAQKGADARKRALDVRDLVQRFGVDLDERTYGGPTEGMPGRPSLKRRLKALVDATEPPRLNQKQWNALRTLGLNPDDASQANYDAARQAYGKIMKRTRFIRTGNVAGRSKAELERASTEAISAQKAWKVIRMSMKK